MKQIILTSIYITIIVMLSTMAPAYAFDVCESIKTKQLSHTDMAWMYANGICTKQDYEKAATLYEQAARLGDTTAQFSLAVMYQLGHGVKQSSVEAYAWHKLAMKNATLTYEKWLDPIITTMSDEVKSQGEARLKQLEEELQ